MKEGRCFKCGEINVGGLASGCCADDVFFSFSVHTVLLCFRNLECVILGVSFFYFFTKNGDFCKKSVVRFWETKVFIWLEYMVDGRICDCE